jgi:hypothetical protein
MRFSTYTLAAASALFSFGSASPLVKRQSAYAGYLISTFSDVNPTVQWYLSNNNSPTSFTKINGGNPVLTSTVGTKAVRDVYLTSNGARDQFYLIATGMYERSWLMIYHLQQFQILISTLKAFPGMRQLAEAAVVLWCGNQATSSTGPKRH